jgi:hypothetical protein
MVPPFSDHGCDACLFIFNFPLGCIVNGGDELPACILEGLGGWVVGWHRARGVRCYIR